MRLIRIPRTGGLDPENKPPRLPSAYGLWVQGACAIIGPNPDRGWRVEEATGTYFEWEGHRTWRRVIGEITPDGPTPAIICHGGPGATHDYLEPMAGLAESGRPCVFYDQLGNGHSEHLPDAPSGLLDAGAVPARARRARSRPRDRVALPRRRTVVGRHAGDAARARASARASQHHGRATPPRACACGSPRRTGCAPTCRPTSRPRCSARGGRDDGLARVQGGDAVFYERHVCRPVPSGPRSSRARSTRWTAIRRSTTR